MANSVKEKKCYDDLLKCYGLPNGQSCYIHTRSDKSMIMI